MSLQGQGGSSCWASATPPRYVRPSSPRRIADATLPGGCARGAYRAAEVPERQADRTRTSTAALISRLPMPVQRFFSMRMLGVRRPATMDRVRAAGSPTTSLFGGAPDGVSSDAACRALGHGDIQVKPNIERFRRRGGRSAYVDGKRGGRIDTRRSTARGYKMTFPVSSSPRSSPAARQPPASLTGGWASGPMRPGLYLIGFIQPLRARSCPLPRQQARNGSPTCSAARRRTLPGGGGG